MNLLDLVLLIVFAVAPAIILHEIAHGWVALLMGDPTAKDQGRLTLNPISHIDLVGSILVPGFLFLVHSPFFFGWAKPVPVNFGRIKNYRLGLILVAAAGPITNVILACIYIWIYKLGLFSALYQTWQWAILFNIALCLFNLIPIPPLDGSRILMGILPRQWMVLYSRLEPFGLIIVVVLLQLGMLKFLYPLMYSFMTLLANIFGMDL